MTKFLIVSVLSVLIFLTGCATGPSFQEHSGQLSPLAKDEARIYIYRPASGSSSIKPDIEFDGKVVGQSIAKGFIAIDIKAGVHTLSTSAHTKRTFTFYFRKNEDYYLRVDVKRRATRNDVSLKLVDSDVGAEEITNTSFTGS